MKPSWDDAPEWANWLAMDADGEWYWYDREPTRESSIWSASGRVSKLLGPTMIDWKASKESRNGT